MTSLLRHKAEMEKVDASVSRRSVALFSQAYSIHKTTQFSWLVWTLKASFVTGDLESITAPPLPSLSWILQRETKEET